MSRASGSQIIIFFEPQVGYLKIEAQHQGEGAEAAAWSDLLRVDALLGVNRPQLLHLLQLKQKRPPPPGKEPGSESAGG